MDVPRNLPNFHRSRTRLKRSFLKYPILLALMAGALWLAFRNQDFGELWRSMLSANPIPLLGGVALMVAAHVLRAWRWQVILRPVKEHTSFWRSFKAVMVGYGMNNIIPRSGEVVRPYLMAKGEGFPLSAGLASVVVERLADVVALGILLGISLVAFQAELGKTFPILSSVAVPVLIAMVVFLSLFVWILASVPRTRMIARTLGRPLPPPMQTRFEDAAGSFAVGLQGIGVKAIVPLVAGTAGIWLVYALSMWVSLQAFSDPSMKAIGVAGAMMLLTLSGVAYTIPLPGGVGSYEFLIGSALTTIFAVPVSIANAYSLLTHSLSFLLITIIGLVIMLIEGVSISSARNIGRGMDPAVIPE